MRIGLALQFQKRLGGSWDEAYDELVWQARFADEHGYLNLWMVEHHFTETTTASPSVVLSHVAAITSRIRVGYAVALLPFHHPLRIAEEMLLLDRLSRGRLDMGIGRGHTPIEVATLCPSPERSVELFDDAVTVLVHAFRGEPFTLHGEYWTFPEVQLFPPPVQRGGRFWMPITSPRSIQFAAQHAIAPLLGNRPLDELKATLEAYTAACVAAGHSEEVIQSLLDRAAITRVGTIAATFREGEEQIRLDVAQFHHSFQVNGVPVGDPRFPRFPTAWPPLDDPIETILFRRGVFGTADDLVDQLREFEKIGIRQVSLGFGSYLTPTAERRRRLEQFTREVLPVFHRGVSPA
ncbi:MAG: monooxygenase [Dehalococcoidia bacterium]|nr:MAG: monooxygenase [Dehalococcoidia bacterium]